MEDKIKLRVDKWLWHARFFKTRSIAAKVVSGGQVRLNSKKIHKPSTLLTVEDVLTFSQNTQIRVVKVLFFGLRRGPSIEAQTLYEDISAATKHENYFPKYEGKGRPSKKNRRSIEKLNLKSHLNDPEC